MKKFLASMTVSNTLQLPSQDVLQLLKQNKIADVWVNQRYGSNKHQPYVGEPSFISQVFF